ncbi:hypothetical protein BDY21DRAFT_409271 [Lineolata rhizophorae]|uniref:Uncharacterized protein n=1 Tax=Lineolata rhizophorae TaxID=578093 RepID=A0A6A6P846_9PEZI|nr:hypothetical protein BDY21DRAFT_409271 [Lineolata rhizophorae]
MWAAQAGAKWQPHRAGGSHTSAVLDPRPLPPRPRLRGGGVVGYGGGLRNDAARGRATGTGPQDGRPRSLLRTAPYPALQAPADVPVRALAYQPATESIISPARPAALGRVRVRAHSCSEARFSAERGRCSSRRQACRAGRRRNLEGPNARGEKGSPSGAASERRILKRHNSAGPGPALGATHASAATTGGLGPAATAAQGPSRPAAAAARTLSSLLLRATRAPRCAPGFWAPAGPPPGCGPEMGWWIAPPLTSLGDRPESTLWQGDR